jgi:hypothetical protein
MTGGEGLRMTVTYKELNIFAFLSVILVFNFWSLILALLEREFLSPFLPHCLQQLHFTGENWGSFGG